MEVFDMVEDKKKKLDELIKRRGSLQADVSRVRGRLDSARKDLEEVKENCRKKKLDPVDLETTIQKLEDKFDKESSDLDSQIRKAEELITPFMEN